MSEDHVSSRGGEETDDVGTTVRLLRVAGARVASPDERFERVKAHVQAHWDVSFRRRLARRRVAIWTGLLAAAAALVLTVVRFNDDQSSTATRTTAAWVAGITGSAGEVRRERAAGAMDRLVVDDAILVGESIETGGTGRVALRFPDATSLRLDVASRVKMIAPRAVEVSSGAVYVDTGSTSSRFEIRTPLGTVRDVGTQFEVRLVAGRLRVRVRTGVVELSDGRRVMTGHDGTEILLSATEAESRPYPPYGPDWGWTREASPTIDMESVSLATYLDRLAREQGWTVQYVDPSLAREAGGIILHGSVAGLAATEALDVAIATSGLTYRLDDGRLVVSRETRR